MSVLDRKLRRDLLGTRATLLAILLVIVLGIVCYVTMASAHGNLERSRREYYARCRMADFTISLRKAPLPETKRIETASGVAEVRPRITFDAVIDLPTVEKPISGRIISMPTTPAPVINNIILRRGGYFTGERLEEVIVNDAFARERNIRPGQSIHIILNNRRQELFVVGTAISSEFVYQISAGGLVPDPSSYGILYVRQDFAEETLDFDGACNELVGLLTPEGRAHPRLVLDGLERQLESFGVFAATPLSEQASHRFLTDEITGLRVMSVFMPTIFLGIAALILNILMMRLAEQQRTTIGTLKAIGYSNRDLMAHYLKFGVLIGVVGAVVGIALGSALAEAMTVMYRRFFEFPRLENEPRPAVMIVAMAIGIVFSMLGTLRGVRSVIRLSPAEAMRAKPPVEGGAIGLEKRKKLWRALGFRWQMAVRSIVRHRWRTIVGMFAAACGSALLLVAMFSNYATDYFIAFQFQKILVSDIDLVFRENLDGGALLEAKRLPGVEHAEGLFVVPCEFSNGHRTKKSAITGIEKDARLTVPRTTDGERIPIPEAGLVMSRKLSEILDVRIGDPVTITPIRGRREPRTVPIARIADGFVGMSTYADARYLNRLVDEADAVSGVQLTVARNADDRIALYREIKQLPAVQGVSDNVHTRELLYELLVETGKISIVAFICFAAAIYFGSILTTSLVSLSERKREVATLLVVGYEKRQVGGVFLRESMLVNAVGALLGLPLGFWLILAVLEQYDTELYRFPLVLTPSIFVIAFVLAIVFTYVAHMIVQRAVSRLDWREALNAME